MPEVESDERVRILESVVGLYNFIVSITDNQNVKLLWPIAEKVLDLEMALRDGFPAGSIAPADIRRDVIYEVLKSLGYSCPGGPRTCICDLCNIRQYCNELRKREPGNRK